MYHLLLSSGRTGTTFLTDAIQRYCPEVKVLQEPVPSRTIYMLANAADHDLPLRYVAYLLHKVSQKFWQRRACRDLIEVNPFVSPIAHLIRPTKEMNKVLMLVRHPDSWIDSMLDFRGYAWRAKVTPYLPFVYARPAVAKAHWKDLSEEEKFAYRWVQIHYNILQCVQNGFDLMTIRYEDLFVVDELDIEILQQILSFFCLEVTVPISPTYTGSFRRNPSNRKRKIAWYDRHPERKPLVDNITAKLRQDFCYE